MKARFPQYLSSPYQILWFESDELVMIFITFILALTVGSYTWILLFAGPWLYRRMKLKYPRGFLKHLLVIIGLVKIHGYPDFFEEEFRE
jgi:type IV conjugative transfer system protein TraL